MAEETATTATLILTSETFEAEVLKFPGVVFVDFAAEWCTPCKVMHPKVEELAQKYKDNENVKVATLDVDEAKEISQNLMVLSIPNFKVFVNGEVDGEQMGTTTTAELDKLVVAGLEKFAAAK